ncbi:HD domain-containing phosphohydrolase [Nitrospina watsonii]|uniref:Response regulatory domain-containing protein n=1 Tax=Nitrospina watsonii TaxID=1323948 RepID=A0ABM9HBY3_9BACT|nr:HD domain-containing phosphohydrolase [Nitrospina watsonii]CAI2717609.1 Response regulatory domain-containing protein [Nitrospina watsonii]
MVTDPESKDQAWTVLLVDDQPDNLAVLRGTLEREGYQLAFASTGEDALAILPELKPNLVLLDVMMPGIDGFETCRQMKQMPACRDIPVIFVTARRETYDLIEGFSAGGVDYITKPFQQEEVCARVRCQIELVILRQSLQEQYSHTQELLSQTLTGSLQIFHEVLAGFDHNLFNQAARLCQLLKECGPALGFPNTSQLEIAAMFLPIGLVSLPPATMTRYREGESLSAAEQAMIQRVPQAGAKLLEKIPHLRKVSEMVLYHQKGFDGSGFPENSLSGEAIPLGARALKLLSDFVKEEGTAQSGLRAITRLRQRSRLYDPYLMEKLEDYVFKKEEEYDAMVQSEKAVSFQELRTGLVLADRIENKEGVVLLNPGQMITDMHLLLLRNHKEFVGIREPIRVREG